MLQNRLEHESSIIAAAIKGEAKAQRKIYDLLAPTMMGVCYRYVSDYETAKDMLQDGFVKLFSKLDSFAGNGSFEGWARRVFVTTCLEYLRQKDALKMSSSIDDYAHQIPEPDGGVIDKISADDLMKMIGGLADGYRTVFNMYVIEGFSHAEIAQMLGINEVTSRTQFSRARKILQEEIGKKDGNGRKRI